VAKIKHNVILDGISGKVSSMLVFRQGGGKTIMAKALDMNRKISSAQRAHLDKFECVKEYARKHWRIPAVKAIYKFVGWDSISPYDISLTNCRREN
jgi:hypothetical protein